MGHPSATPAWRNWSRTVAATPQRVACPDDQDELTETVRSAAGDGLQVRAVGAGHSFTPVAASDGVQLRLDRLNALERVEAQADGTTHVTVGAGIRLRCAERRAGGARARDAQPRRHRQAVDRRRDLDRHPRHRCAASAAWRRRSSALGWSPPRATSSRRAPSQPRAVRAGTSRPRRCRRPVGRHPRGGARLPARGRRGALAPRPGARALDGADGLVEGNDHFEFYWFPHTRRALTKRNNRVDADDARRARCTRARLDRRRAPVQRAVRDRQHRRDARPEGDRAHQQRCRRAP